MAEKKNKLIKKEDKATLSNVLNEMMYEEKMTLSELRFFLVYLSKINPKNPDETEITFSLEEFADILDVELNESLLNKIARKLLRYVVTIRPQELDDDVVEDIIHVQLFRKSRMYRKKVNNKWYFTFACHDEVKEHLFEFKERFTSLEVWNIINLHSFQDARMYMLLKQYLKIGERTIDLQELKKMLGIAPTAYSEYKIFSRDVLKKSQKSLKKYTDIEFDYHAVGRPARAVYFEIRPNKKYQMPKFLRPEVPNLEPDLLESFEPKTQEPSKYINQHIDFLASACDYEFDGLEMESVLQTMKDKNFGDDFDLQAREEAQYHFLARCYSVLKLKARKGPINDRFAYFLGIVKNME